MTDAPPAALFAVELSRVWNEGGSLCYDQVVHRVGRIQEQQSCICACNHSFILILSLIHTHWLSFGPVSSLDYCVIAGLLLILITWP